MTRTEIETQAKNYLDRAGDLVIEAAVPFWFRIAHKAIQRLRNWKIQETTGYETLVTNTFRYCAPTDVKEGFTLYSFDSGNNQLINMYHQVDIQTVRAFRFNFVPPNIQLVDPLLTFDVSFDPHVFAIWAEDLEIFPTPGSALDGKQLRWDYYRWVEPPGEDCADWFTQHAGDYLLYRMLQESVPFLDSTDNRLQIWSNQMIAARNEILGVDVSATWATDSLQMRG